MKRAVFAFTCLSLLGCPAVTPRGGGGGAGPRFSGPVGDVNAISKVNESKLPGGDGKLVRLHDGFVDLGTGQPQSSKYWSFEMEAVASGSEFTLNTVAPLYMFMDKNGNKVGQNVVNSIPGVAGYSPYWQIHQVTVPDSYVPNSVRTMSDVQTALGTPGFKETVMNVAVNCPIVAQATRLEGAEDQRAEFGWYEGKRTFYFPFDTLRVTDHKVPIAPIWVFMPRDADPMNSAAPNAKTTTQPIANYDKARANPNPFLNQDQGEGKLELNNNLIDVLPNSDNPGHPRLTTPQYPDKDSYSALWQVIRVNVPDNYRFRSVTTKAALTPEAGFQVTKAPMIVNCPLLESLQR